MNILCRRRAAFEGILGLRTRMPWLSTLVMPADSGTRPDARGQLSLADPQWFAGRLAFSIFDSSAVMVELWRTRCGVTVQPVATGRRAPTLFLQAKEGNRLLTRITTGHVMLTMWWYPSRILNRLQYGERYAGAGPDDDADRNHGGERLIELLSRGCCICVDRGAHFVIVDYLTSSIWRHPLVVASLAYGGARHCRFTRPYGPDTEPRWCRMASTLPVHRLKSLNACRSPTGEPPMSDVAAMDTPTALLPYRLAVDLAGLLPGSAA